VVAGALCPRSVPIRGVAVAIGVLDSGLCGGGGAWHRGGSFVLERVGEVCGTPRFRTFSVRPPECLVKPKTTRYGGFGRWRPLPIVEYPVPAVDRMWTVCGDVFGVYRAVSWPVLAARIQFAASARAERPGPRVGPRRPAQMTGGDIGPFVIRARAARSRSGRGRRLWRALRGSPWYQVGTESLGRRPHLRALGGWNGWSSAQ
jgi:hypothetical protein